MPISMVAFVPVADIDALLKAVTIYGACGLVRQPLFVSNRGCV